MKRERLAKHSIAYNGTFEGFLSYVYYQYKNKYNTVSIDPILSYKPTMSSQRIDIITDEDLSLRVLKGIIIKSSQREIKEIYALFLSHEKGIESKIFERISLVLSKNKSISDHYASKDHLAALNQKIIREIERIQSQITFHQMRNDISFGTVKPSFNILPLLIKNLKSKISSTNWILFDEARKYAIYHLHGNIRFIDQSEPILSDPDFIPIKTNIHFPTFIPSAIGSSASRFNPNRNWLDIFHSFHNQ
jgi:probable DNA metabolism protein